jgi:hypothetical protein
VEIDPVRGNDLGLHQLVIEHVRSGRNYHQSACEEMAAHHFIRGSPFNVRLPAYAWLMGAFPNDDWGRYLLSILALGALLLIGIDSYRELGLFPTLITGTLLGLLVWWCFVSQVMYLQEMWSGTLIVLSLGAYGLGWWPVAVATGLAALFFRELALPYCVVSATVAWAHGHRREATTWFLGLLAFAGFLAWHAAQVARFPSTGNVSAGHWVQFGGLPFHLTTVRMYPLFIVMNEDGHPWIPGWVVGLYLSAALVGLSGWKGEQGQRAAGTMVLWLLAFAVLGSHYHRYWGWLYSPLLALGPGRAPAALADLIRALRHKTVSGSA